MIKPRDEIKIKIQMHDSKIYTLIVQKSDTIKNIKNFLKDKAAIAPE